MFRKSQLKSKKFAKKRKRFFWIKIGFFFFIFVLLISLLSYLLKLQKITIDTITVQGNSAIIGEEIISLINQELQGEYYWIFPKKNIFIFPKNSIKDKILDTWKRAHTVDIERDSLTSLKIVIIEKKAKSLWCDGQLINNSNEDQCYFIDETGYVFSKAPAFSDNVYFRYYGNIPTSDPIGQKYLPTSNFQILSNFIQDLEKLEIRPSKLLPKAGGEYELYLEDGSRILFYSRDNYSRTLGNLETLFDSDVYKKDIKKSISPVDYIDVRFGNKVSYKFK